jgi:GNAT superfamily N-acetyltransferase
MSYQDEQQRILDAHAALVAEGILAPVSDARSEARLWLDCELASFVENRFLEPLDPRTFDAALRTHWKPRALCRGEYLADPHRLDKYQRAYWIIEKRERVGTIALDLGLLNTGFVTVASLYLFPTHRGRGIASRVLGRARDAVCERGARGLRVPTWWSWQHTVRFYLNLGMWLSNWKHALVFRFVKDEPAWRIDASDEEARFSVVQGGVVEELIRATREGERLGWTELPAFRERRRLFQEVTETFALGLAVRGFPLIRSEEAWDNRHWHADGGDVEGLAYKIEIFEAIDRRYGFALRTPRIPGLQYRDYDDID